MGQAPPIHPLQVTQRQQDSVRGIQVPRGSLGNAAIIVGSRNGEEHVAEPASQAPAAEFPQMPNQDVCHRARQFHGCGELPRQRTDVDAPLAQPLVGDVHATLGRTWNVGPHS